MEDNKRKALHEAYLCIKDNLFFGHLLNYLDERETYLANGLCNTIDWEDVCRLQGQLKMVRSIKAEINQTAICETEQFDNEII